jgi:hypothetical protein
LSFGAASIALRMSCAMVEIRLVWMSIEKDSPLILFTTSAVTY